MRIHILFLKLKKKKKKKGADVIDLQFTDLSPRHHEESDFEEKFLDD